VLIRDKGKNAPITCIVPLKDIIVAWFSSPFQFLNDLHALGNWYFFFFFIYLVKTNLYSNLLITLLSEQNFL
jgi:hypothetical protein